MKTISLKKVSAVAVASLGFGLLSVVPAQAAALASTVGTVGTAAQGAVVGTAATSTVGFTTAATTADAADTYTTTTVTLTVPTGSTVTLADRDGAFSAATTGATATLLAEVNSTTGAVTRNTAPSAVAASINAATAVVAGTVTIVPDVPGLYSINMTITAGTVTRAYIQAAGTAATVASTGLGSAASGAVAGGIAQFTFTTPAAQANGDVYRFVSSGVGGITAATGVAADGTTGNNPTEASGVAGNWGSGATWTRSNASAGTATITVSSAVAGAQTVTINSISATTGAPTAAGTITITWGATPVVTTGTTTSRNNTGTGVTATGSDDTVVASRTLATQAANIVVTIRDAAGSAMNGQTVSATIAGPGLISARTGANAGTGTARATSVALAANVNVASVAVWADGTAGVGTITILVGTTVVGTETVTFFGAPASITAVQNHKVLSNSGGAAGNLVNAPTGADIANTPSVILTVLDANGTRIPGLSASATSISAVSSDPTVVSSTIGVIENTTAGAGNTVTNTYNAQVTSLAKASGSTATLTFRVALGTSPETYVSSAPLTYTLGGSVAAIVLNLDRTSYTPGQAAQVTLALRDSSGNAARDGDHANMLAGALSTNLGISGSMSYNATATTVSSLGGLAVAKINAPATGGTWTVSGTTGTAPSTAAEKSKALTASATVVSETAGLLTQIDALNAKIVALNALIAKIMKKLGVK